MQVMQPQKALSKPRYANFGRFKIHVLMPDLEARGLADRIIEGVSPVDYGGFVDLVAGNNNCQSWL
jgi:tRNA 2-thiouridine synthesizing protein B